MILRVMCEKASGPVAALLRIKHRPGECDGHGGASEEQTGNVVIFTGGKNTFAFFHFPQWGSKCDEDQTKAR